MSQHRSNKNPRRQRPKPDLSRIHARQSHKYADDPTKNPQAGDSNPVNLDQQLAQASHSKSEMNRHGSSNQVIVSRRFDLIAGGGLSLLVAAVVIALSWSSPSGAGTFLLAIELYLFTDLFINGPHFMASYRLLYSRRTNFRKHPLVTLAFPFLAGIFLAYIIYCSYQQDAQDPLGIMGILTLIAPVVLAWHYTGQSWGTTACFAHLSGLTIRPKHRRLIRGGFLTLFIYHVAWAYDSTGIIQNTLSEQEAGEYLMRSIMSLCRVVVAAGFIAGLFGFWDLSKQTGKRVPIRTWLPWAGTFSWYVMVDLNPASFFLLQFFHAFQYLMFPLRVELNDYAPKPNAFRHLIFYYVTLVSLGYLAFEWSSFDSIPKQLIPAGTAMMMMINLHHYFIDAVIWKIREPEVRKSLFGHLTPN